MDESIGRQRADTLRKIGYDIVYRPHQAELDSQWLNKAFAAGALFVVSPDLDIPCLIEKENYPMIWIDYLFCEITPQMGFNAKRRAWTNHIDKRIKSKLQFLNSRFGT